MLPLLNILAVLATGFFSSWAVLWPGFRDGLFMKLGFILLSLASIGKFDHLLHGYVPSGEQTFYNVGLSMVVVSMAVRRMVRPVRAR